MEKLGIEPIQLATQIINFLIMVFILSKFLYKPIIKKLEERKKKIEEGLEFTQKMLIEDEKTEKKRQEILDKAKIEAVKLVDNAKLTAKKLAEERLKKADEEASGILVKAREELETERQNIRQELRSETVELAQSWLEILLGKALSEKTQKSIIDKKISELVKLN